MEKKLLDLKRLRALLVLSALMLLSFSINAQSISGTVTDENGEGLVGANIVVKGTTSGTITDMDGNYSLELPANATTLIYSMIGYQKQEVEIAGKTEINLQMQVDDKALDEVIVVGYGTVKKKLSTGANTNVKGEDIQALNTGNAMDALKGITAGVSITQSTAEPGAGSKVYIRGIGTVGNSSPLYVVDGVIQGNIDYLSPNDIESLDVLKDAASAAIYGSRAANGVILVTTKGGKKNMKTLITYDGYYGVQNVYKKPDLLNAQEYAMIMDESVVNSGLAPHDFASLVPRWDEIEAGTYKGTNWFEEMMIEDAPVTQHSINIQGGTDKSIYSMGASYYSQDGVFGKQSDNYFKRINLRLNSEHVLFAKANHDILKIGENLTYTKRKNNGVRLGNIYWNDVHNAVVASPFLPLYNEDGDYHEAIDWDLRGANPAALMDYLTRTNENDNNNIVGSVYLDFKPIKNLTVKTRFGVNASWGSSRGYTPQYDLATTTQQTLDIVRQSMYSNASMIWDNTITYNFDLNDEHHFTALVGQSLEKNIREESLRGQNVNYNFDDWKHAYLSNTIITEENLSQALINGGNNRGSGMLSYFGRLSYDYKEKYLLTATLRADGSVNFVTDNRWGTFPSVAAGWVVTNESFLANTSSWLDYLKIRASWGQVGNSSIGNFQYSSTISYLNTSVNPPYYDARYFFSDNKGTASIGGYPARLPNREVSWETSETLDFGLDAHFLNARLQLAFDWYKKDTKDWLLDKGVPSHNGHTTQTVNGGQITNTGIELSLNWNDKIGDLKYGANISLAYNKNEVTAIDNSEKIIHGPANVLSQGTGEIYRAQEGYPVGYFWGYVTDGVIQNQAEADAWVAPTGANNAGEKYFEDQTAGDLRWVDQNMDGVIDDNDKVQIGDPNPDYILGIQLNFDYKGIYLNATANGAFGHQIAKSYRSFADGYRNNYTTDVFNRWHGEGTSNKYPRLLSVPHRNGQNLSDLYIQDADFLRISNITLGYNFKNLFQNLPLGEARLYVTAQNIYTFTKYDGMDPEVGASGTNDNWASGIDLGLFPSARTYLVGLSLKF